MSTLAPHDPPTFDEQHPALFSRYQKAHAGDFLIRFFSGLTTEELKIFAEAWLERIPKRQEDDGSYEYTLTAAILPEVIRRMK